jgi:signal transduction histidine kinase
MRNMGRAAPSREVERTLLQLTTALAFGAVLAFLWAGWYNQDMAMVAGVAGPAIVTAMGASMLITNRDHLLPVLFTAAVVVVIQNRALGNVDLSNASLVPLVTIGITGAFFIQARWVVPYIVSYSTLVFASRLWWPAPDVQILQAVLVTISVAFGAALLSWIRREFEHRETLHRNLFEHAPVSLWEEDFSLVGQALQRLRDDGVEDLEEYLDIHQGEVRRLAPLVCVTDANKAAVSLTKRPTRAELLGALNGDRLSDGASEALIPQFMAIWNDEETVATDLIGDLGISDIPIEALLVWSAPRVEGALDLTNVIVAIVDITHQRDVERRLHELIRSKDQFVATVSHELRTPLTAIVGISEELRTANGTFSENEKQELIAIIAEQSLDVSRIVDDLLVAARTDTGGLEFISQPVDLAAEAAAVLRSVGDTIPVEADDIDPVLADPTRVRQIVRNLLTNAVRYGGPSIRVVIADAGDHTTLEVRDNGSPLPRQLRATIFEPYFEAGRRSGVTGSVGLGLTVSRQLAHNMGGDLTYDHDGSETVFTLTLEKALDRKSPDGELPVTSYQLPATPVES